MNSNFTRTLKSQNAKNIFFFYLFILPTFRISDKSNILFSLSESDFHKNFQSIWAFSSSLVVTRMHNEIDSMHVPVVGCTCDKFLSKHCTKRQLMTKDQ